MNRKLKIEYESTGALAPYARNANEHPDWQVDQIANSSRKGDLVLDPRYCDVILERWEAMTGETAVLEEA